MRKWPTINFGQNSRPIYGQPHTREDRPVALQTYANHGRGECVRATHESSDSGYERETETALKSLICGSRKPR